MAQTDAVTEFQSCEIEIKGTPNKAFLGDVLKVRFSPTVWQPHSPYIRDGYATVRNISQFILWLEWRFRLRDESGYPHCAQVGILRIPPNESRHKGYTFVFSGRSETLGLDEFDMRGNLDILGVLSFPLVWDLSPKKKAQT